MNEYFTMVNGVLYVRFRAFLAAGFPENTVLSANLRNGSHWLMITDPLDRRRPLVRFDTLRQQHKDKLNAHFVPSVPEYFLKAPIVALVVKDAKAEAYYREYRYNNDTTPLPAEAQAEYTTAASWMNMLITYGDDLKFIRKTLNIQSVVTFYDQVGQLIRSHNIGLPNKFRPLRNRMREYQDKGYDCLVHGGYGNKNPAKIGVGADGYDPELYDKQVALIRKVASLHNNFNAAQVRGFCKPLFDANGWQMVGDVRMRQILDDMQYFTTPGKRGAKAFNNTMQMHVKRIAPDAPLKYWTLDGWTAELLYQDKTGYSNRLVIVVVLDAYNKYPIGYAIGDRECADLIKQALRNAILHVHEITSGPYRAWQLQSDNYAIKTLTPFYEACGHLFTPAAVGNAKSKIIEPYFNSLNRNYCQTQYNWSGHNITARQENQPNTEFLNKIKKSLPFRDEVEAQIEAIMMAERERKQADLLEAWAGVPEADRCRISKADMLMAFGTNTGFTNRINGYGLTPTIEGRKMYFDTFDPAFRELINIDWMPVYDPADLSQILAVSKCGKNRFMLDARMDVAMDARSATPEMNEHRAQIAAFNKKERERITRTYLEDAEVVDELVNSTPLALNDAQETSLKLMLTNRYGQQKEDIQDARGLKRLADKQAKEDARAIEQSEANWAQIQMSYLNNKTNMEDYLND
jgi:hypothetical protein